MTNWNPTKKEFWTKENLLTPGKRAQKMQGKWNDRVDKAFEDDWEHCPRCKSNRVNQVSKLTLLFMTFATGSALTFFGLLLFPLLFIGIPLIILSPVTLLIPKFNQCKDCNNVWKAVKPHKRKAVE